VHAIKKKTPLRLIKPLSQKKREAMVDDDPHDYHRQIERYAQQIRQTNNVDEIINLLDEALLETRALHSHNEVQTAREQVNRAEQKLEALRNELEQLRGLVHADPLTGALNRSGLGEAYAREAARADRHGSPLCVAMLDLDDFKQVNDIHGHQAGDDVLLHLVTRARETLRPSDIIARFGGEEFVVLLPDTGIEAGVAIIGRLQHNLATHPCLHANQSLPITFSAGIAARAPHEQQGTVINRADEAMYRAKQAGKNRVFTAPD
jgi:diguanylate cyclase (GGDEF)-like protein